MPEMLDSVSDLDPKKFHHIGVAKKQRLTYKDKDFIDYVVMIIMTCGLIALAYGPDHAMTIVGIFLSVSLIPFFAIRHGIKLTVPLIIRQPVNIFYLVYYKLEGIHKSTIIVISWIAIENIIIYLTPNLPHKTDFMRSAVIILFFAHFFIITAFRTASFIDHLRKKNHVREVLLESPWQKFIKNRNSIVSEIVHAYFTGLLTHIVSIAPWYVLITHVQYSVLLLPLSIPISIFAILKVIPDANKVFYREHWLAHNLELDFVYLHGPHHDAIPSSIIAFGENGILEGYWRGLTGFNFTYLHPFLLFLILTREVHRNMVGHQYIPNIFPENDNSVVEYHHAEHHYLSIRPYGLAMVPGENSPPKERYYHVIDSALNGYNPDNTRWRWYAAMKAKYEQKSPATKTQG
jgi:hypothetical protein